MLCSDVTNREREASLLVRAFGTVVWGLREAPHLSPGPAESHRGGLGHPGRLLQSSFSRQRLSREKAGWQPASLLPKRPSPPASCRMLRQAEGKCLVGVCWSESPERTLRRHHMETGTPRRCPEPGDKAGTPHPAAHGCEVQGVRPPGHQPTHLLTPEHTRSHQGL